MAAPRRVRTPVAGPAFTPLQALPLGGTVTVLEPTSVAPVSHVVSETTSVVQIYASADVYVAVGRPADASCWLLKGPGYATYGVDAGVELSFRAVTGSASVRILEA